jgi:hypothetical protein
MRYSWLLSDAVDEGLSKLGRLPKEAIYQALETNFSMRKRDIPARFAEFSSILLGNVGPSARPVLEYIVDRFASGLDTQCVSSIDLDESIKRVDMILNGSIDLPARTSDSTASLAGTESPAKTGRPCRANRGA